MDGDLHNDVDRGNPRAGRNLGIRTPASCHRHWTLASHSRVWFRRGWPALSVCHLQMSVRSRETVQVPR